MASKATTGRGILNADFGYPGWKVVAAGFLIFFFAFGGPTASMPLVYNEVIHEFGWSRTTATLIYTWKGITGAVVAIFLIGPLVDRFGLKPVFITVVTLQAIGFAAFLAVHSVWTYYLTGFLIGLGQGAVLLCIKLMVSRWFIRNVGLAGAMALVGSSIGGIVFPWYIVAVMPELGWRMTFALIGIGIFAVAVPLILLANQNPTEEELLPEISGEKGVRQTPEAAAAVRSAELDVTYGQLIRQPMFWCIILSVMIIAGVDQGLFQNSQLYFTREAGLSPKLAVSALSITFLIGMLSKFVAGWFFDTYSVRGVMLWYLLIAVMVLLAFPVSNYATALVFSFALGVAHGGLVCEGPVLAKHVYGPKHMNRVLPVITGFFSLGSATGPAVLAAIYDSTGSYTIGFGLFVALALVAALMLSRVQPVYRNRLEAATGGA
ncbi:MFS transporter [Sphingomonas canadensis]|uniref:MFS transporter n=1 Tax=Sphingomonas canadensis TaxID=1219257 RepID=A0ABW3H8S3_9SPHN|nr:MFS transporter [Sphingomonas canadensis]MCW3837608.1 MFS transporter [Sphingomonas canadensis]